MRKPAYCMCNGFYMTHWVITTVSALFKGERGDSVEELRTTEREVGGSKPVPAVVCP